jgi:predicted MFS family arabinose efflux permease
MQMSVDGAVRGRVLSLYGMVFVGGPAAGALIMGGASEVVGLRAPLLGGAALVLLVWLWAWQRRASIAQAIEAPAGD